MDSELSISSGHPLSLSVSIHSLFIITSVPLQSGFACTPQSSPFSASCVRHIFQCPAACDFLVHLSFSPSDSFSLHGVTLHLLLWHVMASLFLNSACWTNSFRYKKGPRINFSLWMFLYTYIFQAIQLLFNSWIFTISTFLLVCLDQLSHCVWACGDEGKSMDLVWITVSLSLFLKCVECSGTGKT